MDLRRPTKWMMLAGRTGTAFHEAGHATMAMYYGLPMRHMTVDDDGSGYTGYKISPLRVGQWEEINITLGGIMATRIKFRLSYFAALHVESKGADVQEAYEHFSGEPRGFFDAAMKEICKILRQRWHEVEALALALGTRNRLEQEEIYRIASVAAQDAALTEKVR